ncbi:hypothetical protein TELCIR_02678 [Teladorsagia circumcincta]|uniref:Uncharacterized protein n=1 Tax=Teladorsagia circumcincta TaxID=45464 RepID=A0A2G9UZZ5_TELCI|nr:hypothetical protein TELCIR_02678 [Teladorsagia circumcincta]
MAVLDDCLGMATPWCGRWVEPLRYRSNRMNNRGRSENKRIFFEGDPVLSFGPSASDTSKGRTLWDVDLVGRAPAWADMAAVFIVDLIRQETRVLEKRSKVEPLKWAMWRMYLIIKFDTSAFVAQSDLQKLCARWTKEQASMRSKPTPSERGKGAQDYRFLSTARACDIISK